MRLENGLIFFNGAPEAPMRATQPQRAARAKHNPGFCVVGWRRLCLSVREDNLRAIHDLVPLSFCGSKNDHFLFQHFAGALPVFWSIGPQPRQNRRELRNRLARWRAQWRHGLGRRDRLIHVRQEVSFADKAPAKSREFFQRGLRHRETRREQGGKQKSEIQKTSHSAIILWRLAAFTNAVWLYSEIRRPSPTPRLQEAVGFATASRPRLWPPPSKSLGRSSLNDSGRSLVAQQVFRHPLRQRPLRAGQENRQRGELFGGVAIGPVRGVFQSGQCLVGAHSRIQN